MHKILSTCHLSLVNCQLSLCTLLLALCTLHSFAQDSLINRDVTVEREFQPVIQQAGKINLRPTEAEYVQPAPAEVTYSTYTPSLMPAHNINPLLSQPMKFQTDPLRSNGYLRAAIGHPQTMLEVGYRHSDGKRNSLGVAIEHEADWGLRSLSHTALEFDFTHDFKSGKVYFRAMGANDFFSRYGRYFSDSLGVEDGAVRPTRSGLTVERLHELPADDRQAIWRAEAALGIESSSKQDLQYKAEVAYKLYNIRDIVTEHQADIRLNMSYKMGDHRVGGNLYSQNQFMDPSDSLRAYYESTGATFNSRHAVRIEPFYEYRGRRVMLHAGVNLDFNVGKGNQFSATNDSTPLNRQVAFAPSPNVRMEAQLAPKWAILYLDARGSLGTSSMPGYISLNRYQDLRTAIISHHVSGYVPVDAELGFMFRPHRDLLVQVHAGYQYAKNQAVFAPTLAAATADEPAPEWNNPSFLYTDYHRWKIGGSVDYHYRDIIDVHVWGDYYIYSGVKNNTASKDTLIFGTADDMGSQIYDRPNWNLGVRIDGHIDSHWSVYTHNSFMGKRMARTQLGDRELPAWVDVNIGTGYHFGGTGNKALDRLYLFFELQNIIHRHNMVWYGYSTEGIHGRVGLTYRF